MGGSQSSNPPPEEAKFNCDFGSILDQELNNFFKIAKTNTYQLDDEQVDELYQKLKKSLDEIFSSGDCDTAIMYAHRIKKDQGKNFADAAKELNYVRHFLQAFVFNQDMKNYQTPNKKFNENQIEGLKSIREQARIYKNEIYWKMKQLGIPGFRDLYDDFEKQNMVEVISKIDHLNNYREAQVSKCIY